MRIAGPVVSCLCLFASGAQATERLRDRVARTADPSSVDLEKLRTPELKRLLQLAASDRDPDVRANAREWLADPQAPEELVTRALDQAPARERSEALFVRALREGALALPDLVDALGSPTAAVRAAAARALAVLATDEAREALERQVSAEENAAVRARLQQSLSRMQP